MSFISKTFGGLNKSYYFRHFFFGLIIFILLEAMFIKVGGGAKKNILDGGFWAISGICLLFLFLYPYSRFIYESIVEYIFGNNVFIVNGLILLVVKTITMLLCFMFSWAIAPIGLIYLYFYYSRQEKLDSQQCNEQDSAVK
ncbi:hypothetical protein [Gallibacterium anatis]|uniref:hypothetical protein n=1 Tax=Gallibacterium anatis TaxID=750 RepID=UPI00057E78D5|nr:hypothetical protein [Gallibacterium anatis]